MVPILDKIRENMLKWFSHVMHRGDSEVVRVVIKMKVEEKRGRKRLKKIWL